MHFSGSHAVVIIAALQGAVASYASSVKQQDYHDDSHKLPGMVYLNMHPLAHDDKHPAVINIEIGNQYGRWGQPPHTRTVWVNFPSEEDAALFHTFSVSFMRSIDPKKEQLVEVQIEYQAPQYMTDTTLAGAQYLGRRLGELICEFLGTGSVEPGDLSKLSKR